MIVSMNVNLQTPRLQLRPCQITDLAPIHTLWTTDRIRYFLFDDRVITLDETRSFLQDSLTNFDHLGYGIWLVFSQLSDRPIGFAGCLQSDHQLPSLIYGIHPDHWGKGYATEAARAVLYYVATLPFPQIEADVDEPNVASVRVLEKLGMQQVKRAIVHGKPLLYYSATISLNLNA
jgi:RimJ/RimL family protein N-acetyltransferase